LAASQDGFQYSSSGRYVYCGFQAEAVVEPLGDGDADGAVVGAAPLASAPAATGAVASSSIATKMCAAFCGAAT
jgi:hypothetical protein